MKRSSIGPIVITTAGSLAFCAGLADAQCTNLVHIQEWHSAGCASACAPAPCLQCNIAPFLAQVVVESCSTRINIFADGLSTSIHAGNIDINNTAGNNPNPLEVFIGQGSFPYSTSQAQVVIGNVGRLRAVDPDTRINTYLAGHIGGNFTSTVGASLVGRVYRLDVDGALGGLLMDESPGTNYPRIIAGSTVAGTSITCTTGTVHLVQVTGDVLGNIAAPGGGIIDVLAGNLRGNVTADDFIGNIDATGAIATSGGTAVTIQTSGNDAPIGFIRGTSINANITAGPSNDRGVVEWVKTTSGNLTGAIVAQSLADPAAGVPVVDVAGSLAASITVGSGGLQGQIIINGGNSGGSWTGTVTIGSTTLSGPYYSNTASSLGGGAVGLAPFHLHDEDCTPPNGYSGAPPGDNKLRLRWYGPLSWSSGDPVTVEYRVHPSQNWTDITGDFTFEINPSNPRELVLTPDTPWDLDAIIYRVIPTSNLKCAGVTGAPAVYNLDTYIVDIDF
ncbi:MAG: hypothetical protein ACKVU4_10345 [Phycisphaerales bacterium]